LNSIQTNGTLLNDDWLDFVIDYNFNIGISLDGPAKLHDKNRVFTNHNGTFDSVMSKISLLEKRRIRFGLLAVISEETIKLGADTFIEFYIKNDLKNIAILIQRPALIAGRTDYVMRDKYAQFVNEIFDLWFELDDPTFHIREFESIMSAIIGGQHSSCVLAGGCIGKYFAIDTAGYVYHCDEFMFDPNYKIGNLKNDSFTDIMSNHHLELLRRGNEKELAKLNCKWISICNGGCPKDRYVARMFHESKDNICCGFSDLIEHIYSRLSQNDDVAKAKIMKQINSDKS